MKLENLQRTATTNGTLQSNAQIFQFQAFREILDEIDRQNHELIVSQLSKQVSFNKSIKSPQNNNENQKTRNNIDQQMRVFAGKFNQDSGDFNHSNNFKTYMETVSTFEKNFTISETTSAKQIANTYLKLTIADLPLIVDAINNNTDILRLFFGCKALRKILSTGNECTIKDVIKTYDTLGKRLVYLLMMPQNQEIQVEILWALVNITSLKDNTKMKQLIEFGLFESIICLIDEDVESIQKIELSLQVACNSIADQDNFKKELLHVEHVKGQLKLTIKDKLDQIIEKIETRCYQYGDNLDNYEELIYQVAMILESFMHSYKILSKKQFRWIVLTAIRLFLMHTSERTIDSLLITLKCGSQHNEYADHILYKHSRRKDVLVKLVALCQNLETYQIAFNSLLIMGNLASSEFFKEVFLVTEGDIFNAFTTLLQNQSQNQLGNQYLHILLWQMSNIIADDETCQQILISQNQQLILLALTYGLQSQSQKVIKEAQVLLDNILDIENCSDFLFQYEELYQSIVNLISYPMNNLDYKVQLKSLQTLKNFIELNPKLIVNYIVNPTYEQKTFKQLLSMQFSPHNEIYDEAIFLIKKFFSEFQDSNELFLCFKNNINSNNLDNQQLGSNQNDKSQDTISQQKNLFALSATPNEYMIMIIDDE